MDWEKKTAARPPLKEAAADVFNDTRTPGQALLSALQSAETVRKDRYASTVAAKMKAAREHLPALAVRHPPRSDTTIFGKPGAEVASLLPDGAHTLGLGAMAGANGGTRKPPPLDNVKAMMADQMQRHSEAWEAFVAVRDDARRALEAAVGSAACAFQQRLAADDAGCGEDLAALDDDRVMRLTEQEVHQVWDCVAQRIPQRARWVEECAAALEEAEERRRVAVQDALVQLCAELNEAAAVSEGEVERLVEKEAMALNVAILENRRAYADLVSRLQVAEVEAERTRRAAWQDGLRRWRVLRTQHAIRTFVERIKSPEFSEPAERLAAFGALRDRQAAALSGLASHWGRATAMAPPHLSVRKVTAWMAEAEQLAAAWGQEWREHLTHMRESEDELDARSAELLEALREEVQSYGGYGPEELAALLATEAGAAVEERRKEALDILDKAHRFLEQQAEQWAAVSLQLHAWLGRLVAMYDTHRSKTGTDEAEIRGALKSAREAFNAADAAREAALDAAVAAVTRGSGETQLDACVAEALQRLDDIEAGYRSFHREMTTKARAYPAVVRHANDTYHITLCGELGVQPQVPPPAPLPEPGDSARAVPAGQPPRTPPPPPGKVIRFIKLSDGRSFAVVEDRYQRLVRSEAEKQQQELIARLKQQLQQPQPPTPEPAPAPASPGASARGKPRPPSSKAAAEAKRAAEEAEAARKAAEDAAKARAEAEAALAEAEARIARSPLSRSGVPLCRTLNLPEDVLRRTIESIQSGLLSDMMTFCQRTLEAAEGWAGEREVALTEELDSWLRHHRPRAGRIEEEVRMARSVELVAQRRRVELHLKAQSKAVKAQAALFDEGLRALEAEVRKGVARLRATEGFLVTCLSSKAIGIRQREAEALRQKLEKELAAKVSELSDRVTAAIAKIKDANRKLEADELRTFESGGKYAEDNAAAYRRSLAAIDAHLDRAGQEQAARLEAARAGLAAEADTALSEVVGLVPSYLDDMRLLEAMDALVEGARRKAAGELDRNKEAASSISRQLDRLEALLDGRATARPDSAPPGRRQQPSTSNTNGSATTTANGHAPEAARRATSAGSNGPAAAAAAPSATGYGGLRRPSVANGTAAGGAAATEAEALPAAPLERCRAILTSTDELRQALLRQAKVLDFLKSSGLVAPSVDLRVDAAGVDPPPPPLGPPGSYVPETAAAGPAVPPPRPSVAGGKGAKGPAAAAAAAAAAAGGVVKLAQDVEAVIDGCKKETEAVAKQYYAGKDKSRPIRYPARIPPSVEELLRGTDGVLEGLRETTLAYVREAVKELRTQVIRAYRQLERLPSVCLALLAQHEAGAAEAQHQALVGELEGRRQALLKLVEVHRASLHPGMIMPARRSELAAVKSSEADRATAHASLLTTYATQAVDMAKRQSPGLQSRLVRLAGQLAQLFDSFILPQDLPPPGDDDAWVYDLPHKDVKQLMRMALAQAEAEVAPPPPVPEKKGGAGAGAAGAGAGAGGAKAGGKGKGEEPPPERPYVPGQWELPAGNFDLVSLGWLDEEGKPPHGLPQPPPETPPPGKGAKAGAAAGGAGAAAGKRPASGKGAEVVPPGRAPLVEVPPPLAALDTPCHRAVVRAYRAAVQRVEESLRSRMSGHRQRVASWAKDEELWAHTWAQLVAKLEGL